MSTTGLYIVLPPEWKCKWFLESPSWLNVEGFLQGSFLLPALLNSSISRGKHRLKRGYGPCRKKNGPLIWILVSLGLPLVASVLSAAAWADRGTVVSRSSMLMCHIWFESEQGNPAGWLIWGLAGPTSPLIPSFYYAAFKHALDMKERHTVAFLIKAFT